MANRVTRAAPSVTAAGAVAQLLGLAVDARLHRLDPELGAHEGIFTFSNPGHALIAVGMLLVVGGTALFLWGRAAARPDARPWGRAAGAVSTIVLLVFALAAFASALATGRHEHAHLVGPAPTAVQLVAAADFAKANKTGTARFADFRVAQAEGYWQTTQFPIEGKYGPAHFHNDAYARAAHAHPDLIDPTHPPDLVYLSLPGAKMFLLGAMYVAPKGRGPRIGGSLTDWHTHPNLCFGSTGAMLSPTPGQCPSGAVFIGDRVEMLHVWVFDNPDGLFAHGLTRGSVQAAIRQLSTRQ